MTPEAVLENFGAVANAPGGVKRLREMILQLAVMGKLVEQNPEDEPASELLAKCTAAKKAYENSFKLRKSKSANSISLESIPYEIPINWKWVQLDDIAVYIQRGKSPKYDDNSEVKVISQKCVRWEGVDFSPAHGLSKTILEKYTDERFLIDGDLLWNSTGTGTVGRACVFILPTQILTVADSHVTVIRVPEMESHYLWAFLGSPYVQARFNLEHPYKIVSGSTNQVELSTTSVKSLAFPLPPLPEQHRIVAKVDQLMALCDRLEAQQQERSTLVKQSRISALKSLADAQGGEALLTAWKRVQDHLPMLFDHPDDVEDLKKCILQNAVMGKLVSEPRMMLKKLEDVISYGPKNGLSPQGVDYDTETRVFTLSATTKGYVDLSKFKYVEANIDEGSHLWLDNGDVLIQRGNSKEYVGISAVYKGPKKQYIYPDLMIKIKANPEMILTDYLHISLLSPYAREFMWDKLSGTSSTMPKINHQVVKNIPINLPSINIQIRIVQKTQALLSLCDTLQKQLEKSRTIAEQLAQSVVESITGQSTEKQEKMKAPKTELVTKLKLVKKPGAKQHAPLSTILARHSDELPAKALWNTSGLSIDDFYRQLKTEMVNGWIEEPEKARVRIVEDQGTPT